MRSALAYTGVDSGSNFPYGLGTGRSDSGVGGTASSPVAVGTGTGSFAGFGVSFRAGTGAGTESGAVLGDGAGVGTGAEGAGTAAGTGVGTALATGTALGEGAGAVAGALVIEGAGAGIGEGAGAATGALVGAEGAATGEVLPCGPCSCSAASSWRCGAGSAQAGASVVAGVLPWSAIVMPATGPVWPSGTRAHFSGSVWLPLKIVSKWRWQPVEAPVVPTLAMI